MRNRIDSAAAPSGAWRRRVTICAPIMHLEQSDFEHLLELRTGLRRFLHWSEQQARAVGLTPAKHQLLLAVKGHPDPAGPTVGEIAAYLALRHHSAVGLIDRAVNDGLVKRNPDSTSKSVVRVRLTPAGIDKLETLAEAHLQELAHLAPTMRTLWRELEQADGSPHPAARPRSAKRRRSAPRVAGRR